MLSLTLSLQGALLTSIGQYREHHKKEGMRATLQNPLTVLQGLNVIDPEVLRKANLTKPHQSYQVMSTLLPMFMVNICLYRHFLPAYCF